MSFVVQDILHQVEQFISQKDFEGCRNLFLQEIMDWSDYYMENCESSPESDESKAFQHKLIHLWQCYASFEANLKQFKKAVDIYEKAVADPIVGKSSKTYRLFAEYYVARGKTANAQKVYIDSLASDLPQQETNWLWCLLFHLITSTSGVSTSLSQLKEELQKAVKIILAPIPPDNITVEILGNIKANPSLSSQFAADSKIDFPKASIASTGSKISMDIPEFKDIDKEEYSHKAAPAKALCLPAVSGTVMSKTHVAVSSSPEFRNSPHSLVPVGNTDTGDELDNLCGLTNEQLIHLFHNRPPMLFVAPYREPMKNGLRELQQDEVHQLENFLGVPLQSLLHPPDPCDHARLKAEFYLDILEELWLAQALKERHFDAWFGTLKRQQNLEKQSLMEKLKTTAMPDAAAQLEKKKLYNKMIVQREMLGALIHKIFYFLLIEQQKILCELGFPRFHPHLLERIQNINNILPANNSKGLFFDEITVREIASQRRFVCSLLHIRIKLGKKFIVHRESSQSLHENLLLTGNSVPFATNGYESNVAISQPSNDFIGLLSDGPALVPPISLLVPTESIPSVEDTTVTPSGAESVTKKKRRRISIGSQSSTDFDGNLDMDSNLLINQSEIYGQDNSFEAISPEMMSFIQDHHFEDLEQEPSVGANELYVGTNFIDNFSFGENLDDFGQEGMYPLNSHDEITTTDFIEHDQ